MTDNGACFRCGESTDFHIYKSERGENKTIIAAKNAKTS